MVRANRSVCRAGGDPVRKGLEVNRGRHVFVVRVCKENAIVFLGSTEGPKSKLRNGEVKAVPHRRGNTSLAHEAKQVVTRRANAGEGVVAPIGLNADKLTPRLGKDRGVASGSANRAGKGIFYRKLVIRPGLERFG